MGAYESWPPSEPIIWVSEQKLQFIANEGGPNPPEQILTIHNSGAGTINWTISHNCQWLEVDPNIGSSTGQANDVVLSVDVNGLLRGKYNCVLTVSDAYAVNTPRRVIINLYIGNPIIGIAPTKVEFLYPAGAASPEPQTLSIWNDDTGTLDWQITEDCNWLKVDPNAGSSTGEANKVTLSADVSGLDPNIYHCQLMITADGVLNSPQTVEVTLFVGKILHVPSEYGTIQAAIDNAINADTVIVADGTYTGEGNRDIEFSHGLPHGQTRAITVRSANGPEYCIIDCNGTESDRHRGFRFVSGEDANSVISGFTITNGYDLHEGLPPPNPATYLGGAIYCGWSSSPTINNCIIKGNTAVTGFGGGGIACYESNPTVSNCIFVGNRGASDGGGMSLYFYSDPTIVNCTFTGNVGGHGGGMSILYGSDPTIINCTFSRNVAYNGGGIWSDYGEMTVTNCILWGNRDSGGTDESAQIDGTTIVVNYCCIQGLTGVLGGSGNIGDDPCFIEPRYWEDPCNTPTYPWDDIWVDGDWDYHLKSQAGRWDPNSESWVTDANTSVAIDAGDPVNPIGFEPFPNGGIINMGAYGGTAEASKSYFGKPVCEIIVAGDVNGDCIVNFKDFAIMALHWLEDNTPVN